MDRQTLLNGIADISRISGLGDHRTTLQNLMYGMNHRGFGNPVPANTEHHGYTFFSRPCLNLSYHNVLNNRALMGLLTKDKLALARIIRAYLDPISNRGQFMTELGPETPAIELENYDRVDTPFVDPDQHFIPLLTNTLESLSGFPDLVGDTFTSAEGVAREEYSMLDGIGQINKVFDLTANFQNIAGDPITLMFYAWILYGLDVRQGRLRPWPSNVIEQSLDYITRIFRITLDPTRNYVMKIGSTLGFPTNVSIGASFNYDRNIPVSEANKNVTVQFRCMGAEYNDPILIDEFNGFIQDSCAEMRPANPSDPLSPPVGLGKSLARLNQSQKNAMNYRGYPWINPDTFEMVWYVPIEEFKLAGLA